MCRWLVNTVFLLTLIAMGANLHAQNYTAYFTPEVKKAHRTTSANFVKALQGNNIKEAMNWVGPKVSKRKLSLMSKFIGKEKDSKPVKVLRDFDGNHVTYICRYNQTERWYSCVVVHFMSPKVDAKIEKVEHKNAKQVKRDWKKRVKSIRKIDTGAAPKLD